MDISDILKQLSRSLVFIVITGYILFLVPYFLTANMPLQYDYNILSVLIIILVIAIFIIFWLSSFIYLVDRGLKVFKYKAHNEEDIFFTVDSIVFMFAIIGIPISLLTFESILTNINPLIFPIIVFVVIPLIFVLIRHFKKDFFYKIRLIINIFFGLFIIIGTLIFVLKLDINFLVYLMFIFLVIMILLRNSPIIDNEKISTLSFIKFYKKEFLRDRKKSIFDKINITLSIVLIQILFALYDYTMNKGRFINQFRSNTLSIFNIGEFNGRFTLDNEVAKLITDVNKINSTDKYTTIESTILWSNDNYLFINNDKNITVPLKKNNIPIDVIKIKDDSN